MPIRDPRTNVRRSQMDQSVSAIQHLHRVVLSERHELSSDHHHSYRSRLRAGRWRLLRILVIRDAGTTTTAERARHRRHAVDQQAGPDAGVHDTALRHGSCVGRAGRSCSDESRRAPIPRGSSPARSAISPRSSSPAHSTSPATTRWQHSTPTPRTRRVTGRPILSQWTTGNHVRTLACRGGGTPLHRGGGTSGLINPLPAWPSSRLCSVLGLGRLVVLLAATGFGRGGGHGRRSLRVATTVVAAGFPLGSSS